MPTTLERASILKACTALLVFGTAGWLSNQHAVRFWWNFVDYDGDMPYGIVLFLQHINLLLAGVLLLAAALTVAALRGHLRAVPWPSVLGYATGAGVLWMGLPLILGRLVPKLPAPWDVVAGSTTLAASYYGLLVGLSRARQRAS